MASASRTVRMKARNHAGILLAGSVLDPGGYVEAVGPGDAQGLGDIAGIEAAGQHERHRHGEILQQVPVERLAMAARTAGGTRRPRIEHQHVGHLGVELDRRQVGALADRERLDHRQPEHRTDDGDPFRRLLAMQLQQVGLEGGDAQFQELVIGIDRDRDLAGPALHPLPERAHRLEADMARRRRKEHEAHQIGPGLERRIERNRRRQAADFDQDGHAGSRWRLVGWVELL